ncbi:Mur ligase domain-containing protein [Cytophagales bacterium LB-30]|uniref:Mur ligase domain-containing protein n=1 Tax=Shiella aurantiaca TaxID=3058365 RepID=A0ABT8F144_9BACT|nr:Mur ligase domain-containing protein [Shiella aurantiaca]MDN4164175.1 Mur ligase domain-containing protein [Shiella aurantiaca]
MPTNPKRVHFIAIGGSVMSSLAIALAMKGLEVSGSDDEIFDPTRSALKAHSLLPEKEGWYSENITPDLDAVILGMHARMDNPELKKAQELNIPIYSYPAFVYEQSKNKKRVVVGGSHGKTTVTSMIMHVLKSAGVDFDYLVGARVPGFEVQIKLSDAPILVVEGDEYLSSPIDPRPKFLQYHHHIGIVTGTAWDHINVFPTAADYVRQFELFAENTPQGGALIYSEEDAQAVQICGKEREGVSRFPYQAHAHVIENGITYLLTDGAKVPLKIFGKHSMQNINATLSAVRLLGVSDEAFYKAIQSFEGAANRMQLLAENGSTRVYKDFAHAPSKVAATVKALKEQDTHKKLVAALELHTFSSLNKKFLSQYKNTLASADEAYIYYNPHTVEMKRLEAIAPQEILDAFASPKARVYTDSQQLINDLLAQDHSQAHVLFMSSGNFNHLNLLEIARQIAS